jgi:hypothetical protein
MSEREAVIRLVRPMAAMMEELSIDARITLLSALLAQEICLLPPGERDDAMREHLREFPSIFDSTEDGMRQQLAANARGTPDDR